MNIFFINLNNIQDLLKIFLSEDKTGRIRRYIRNHKLE